MADKETTYDSIDVGLTPSSSRTQLMKPVSGTYWADCRGVFKEIWPMLCGNVMEWYEFGIFAYLQDEITYNFFTASWETWLVFALSFLVRPLGGLFFGWLGDHVGRKTAFTYAVIGMTIATVGQGLLPSKKWGGEIGEDIGMVILVIFRMIQGLCTGGEIGGVTTYLSEHGKKEVLGMTVSWVGASCMGAFTIASLVVTIMQACLSQDEMNDWAWRIPFLISLIPAYACLTHVNQMAESEEFKAETSDPNGAKSADEKPHSSFDDIKHVFEVSGKELLLVTFALAGIAVMWYTGPVYASTFIEDNGASAAMATGAASLNTIMSVIFAIPVGYLTDTLGIGKVVILGNIAMVATGLPVWIWLAAQPKSEFAAYLGMGVIYGLAQALGGCTVFLYVTEMFPTSVRNTAVGLSYNLAVGLFGGPAPLVCELLVGAIGDLFPGFFMSIAALVSLVVIVYCRHLNSSGQMTLVHLRPDPF